MLEYEGVNNADDPLVQPWYIPGWTSQDAAADSILAPVPGANPDGFPISLVFAEVTGLFYDGNGSPLGGFVTVLPSDNVTLTTGGVTYRIPARLATQSGGAGYNGFTWANWGSGTIYLQYGRLRAGLLCTDNAGMTTDSGNPLTYYVTEHFTGGRSYQITVPSDSVSPVDINSLIVTGTVCPYKYDPVWPMGNMLQPIPLPNTVTNTGP